jgi:hypothetical protein
MRTLAVDLAAPRWKLTPRGIQVEAKDEIKQRIGRSPDEGDSLVYASAVETRPGAGWEQFFNQTVDKLNEQRDAFSSGPYHH